MTDHTTFATRRKADLIWASGLAKLAEWRGTGPGMLIGFDRVRPLPRNTFRPDRARDVTPRQLDRIIRALKHWRVAIVSIDEACARLTQPRAQRFVSLSFNGIYRDVITFAQPVLAKHDVPYTVYVPSSFPDGIAAPWWLALEAAIAPHGRISLIVDRKEQHFVVEDADRKTQLYHYLYGIMRRAAPAERADMTTDLCNRYGVDMPALTRDVALDWRDIAALAADPRVTIGSATVNYPVLAQTDTETARRDILMGRAVLETALQRPARHFAYPFGDAGSFKPGHADMLEDAGFASAATSMPGTLSAETDPYRLPRVVWTDAMTRRALRVRLAGY